MFRHKQGQDETEDRQHLPMCKGVMDTPLGAAVSQDVNNRLSALLDASTDNLLKMAA